MIIGEGRPDGVGVGGGGGGGVLYLIYVACGAVRCCIVIHRPPASHIQPGRGTPSVLPPGGGEEGGVNPSPTECG